MSQSRSVDMDGLGVGPMGSFQLSLTTLPMDSSRLFIWLLPVFISFILTCKFLLDKVDPNLCKGLVIFRLNVFKPFLISGDILVNIYII